MDRAMLIQEVSEKLNDPVNVRWSIQFLESALHGGLLEIAKFKPTAFTVTAVVPLQPGARQALPDDADRLVEIHRNMGAAGQTPGRSIRKVSYDLLRAMSPLWGVPAASGEVDDYAWDLREPRAFYVYPAIPPGVPAHVEATYVQVPQAGPVPAMEVEAVRDWMCYRAYDIDSGPGSPQRSQQHYQAFVTAMGVAPQLEAASAPERAGGN